MARSLSFKVGAGDFSTVIEKVDRSKIYGTVSIEAFDEDGKRCDLISLDGDGHTLIAAGGVSNILLSEDGDIVSQNELIALSADNEVIEPYTSSFNEVIEVTEKATIEEYLSHLVKSVYQLLPGENYGLLVDLLSGGDIYKFPFSYRGGFISDTAFLLSNESGDPFMIICTPAEINFVAFNDTAVIEDDSEEDSDDDFSFDLM